MEKEVATGVLANVAAPTIQYGLGYLKRKFGYVSNLKKNLVKLEKEKEHLCDKEADVTRRLKINEEKMEKTAECTTWLKEVKEMRDKLEELRKTNQNTRRCFCGLCPFHSLLKLGKTVVEYTVEVTALYNRLQHIDIMSEREKEPPIPVIKKYPEKIDDVPSLNDHVEKLMKWLEGDNFKRLRIWGLPGVGKTTIMKNLNNRIGETQQFDIVLFVDVSEAKSMREEMREVMREEIQEQLVERLQLETHRIRQSDQIAGMISKNLVNKRYLLLLDGVYSEINLNDIGIHDNHEHGKVVFATRYRKVYRSSTDEEINITRLSEIDGQNLFKKIVGDIVDQPEIKPIVKSILRECGGMPQVIMIIAKMLRKEDNLALWRAVLLQLQVPSKDPMGEMEEVYKAFKIVYDRLNRTSQPCLRYWTVFPPDYEVQEDYMTECWKAEQFLAHAETLGNARDLGQSIFNELEDKSLLEKGRKARHFKMPVFLQRMAVKIRDQEEKDSKFLVGEGGEIPEGEELLEKWQSAQRVSLIRQKFTLPQRPACSQTLTLLLQKNPNLTKIPELFFESMCNLRILDLCNTGIMSMPPSISNLINLRLLYLNNCGHIVELPPDLKKLKNLEILDLRNTGILTLPNEIGQLTGLKCLRVSFKNCSCSNGINSQPLLMIPCNVIASLSSLEELSIDVDYKNKVWNQIVDTVAGEVAKLKKLASLCFYFPELTCFETFIKARNKNYMEQEDHGLRSFRIVVGNHSIDNFLGFDFFGYTTERHLRFATGGVIPNAFSNILGKGYSLELIGDHCAKNLSVLGAANLEGLKACTIEECDEMENIIGGESGDIVTGALQKLHLINLPKLVSICEGSNKSGSLNRITTLTLQVCPRLKRLFPQALVQMLCNLKDLQVEDCSELEEIIEGGSIVEARALPKLKNVVLCKLPRLLRIFEDASFEWLSLETMKIQTCPDLKHLPFSMKNATSLRVIECTENWWSQLVWPDDSVQDRLKGLCSFT